MGTPGDKAKIGKVVGGDSQELEPEEEEEEPAVVQPHHQPGTSTGIMGHMPNLPQFQTLSTVTLIPSKPEPETITFQPSSLEQASIEDFFTQSKIYNPPSGVVVEPSTILPTKTFLSDEQQPGPSGLQTPQKLKPSTSLGKIKKGKKPQQQQQTPKKAHTCNVCQKNFTTNEKLAKHQQIHSGASPFKCEHCKKTFTSKFKLVRHALIHSDRKPFSCTVCERTFHRKDHLKNHIKIHSPSKKYYVCEKPTCNKEYTSLLSYRKHLAVHAAEEGNLVCQICNFKFETKEAILYHLKIHAGSRTVKNPNERKFLCEHCDRRFFTKKDVRRHLVVHTGLREFLCQFCPQRFGRKDHLVRHIKKSHNKKYQQSSTSTAAAATAGPSSSSSTLEDIPTSEGGTSVLEQLVKTKLYEPTSGHYPEQDLQFSLEEGMFGVEELQTFLEPSTSRELKDLGGTLFDTEEGAATTSLLSSPSEIVGEDVVLSDPDIQRLLLPTTEESKLRLPAFSQTFQPPPPPPPT